MGIELNIDSLLKIVNMIMALMRTLINEGLLDDLL